MSMEEKESKVLITSPRQRSVQAWCFSFVFLFCSLLSALFPYFNVLVLSLSRKNVGHRLSLIGVVLFVLAPVVRATPAR